MKRAVFYIRVSSEQQASEEKISIDHQLERCESLCKVTDSSLVEVFTDKNRYRKTKAPSKGQIVQPSGKYDDRPGFLACLERIEQGDIDMLVCYDVSRIGRHYRVLGTLSNALDIARQKRNGKPVEVWEASKNTQLTSVMLGLMISIAQEENETRARRVRFGMEGCLKQGRWPTVYQGRGYTSRHIPGQRGHIIELGEPDEVQLIRDMFKWAAQGDGNNKIGRKLYDRGIYIEENNIGRTLRNPAYKGELTYTFKDGESYTIQIPQIITPELWEQVQEQRDRNFKTCKRNTKQIYLAQFIAYCSVCGRAMTSRTQIYRYYRTVKGTITRCHRGEPAKTYTCNRTGVNSHLGRNFNAQKVDLLLWQTLADTIKNNPDKMIEQTIARAKELQAEGDDITGQIERYRKRLSDLDNEEMMYNRQLGRGKLTEANYDALVDEVGRARAAVESDLHQALILRDETEQVKSTLEYARQILDDHAQRIDEIDLTQDELEALPQAAQHEVMRRRQQVVRTFVDKVTIHPDKLEIDGALGKSFFVPFDSQSPEQQTVKLHYKLLARFCESFCRAERPC